MTGKCDKIRKIASLSSLRSESSTQNKKRRQNSERKISRLHHKVQKAGFIGIFSELKKSKYLLKKIDFSDFFDSIPSSNEKL